MAVSSIKGSWHKFFSRIRDYMDVVDSYYRPNDDIVVGGHQSQLQTVCERGNTSNKHNNIANKSGYRNHRHHHTCTAAQLPSGYSKRKTSQGQVYFVDSNNRKYWYDPSVPKELLTATLNLDALIGRLSSTWEIRNTPSGKTYYVNHIKKTTQFTDPRLVAYKEYLMTVLTQTYTSNHKQRAANTTVGQPPVSNSCCPNNSSNSLSRSGLNQNHTQDTVIKDRNSSQHQLRDHSSIPNVENNPRECACSSKCNQESRERNGRQLTTNCSNHPTSDRPASSHNHQTLSKNSLHNNGSSRESPGRILGNGCTNGCPSNPASACPALRSREKQFQLNVFSGSQHNLSTATNRSNTLTGPPSAWFKRGSVSGSRKHQATANDICSSNGHHHDVSSTTAATRTANQSRPTNRSGSISNLYTPSANSTDNQHDKQQHRHVHQSKDNKELFDKISILRQELLKQQVIAHPCKIEVSRKRIFEESFRVVYQMQPRDLKKRLLIKFRGEEGLDYGGVAREWFYLLSREILNPVHGLFQYTSDDIYNLQINPDSGIVYKEHLSYMNFCGRVIGMAVFHGHFIEGHFTLPFYKMLLRKPITLDDIEFVDPDLHRSLCWILDNDITNVIDTTFLVQHNAFGQLQEHELRDNGRNLVVTEENKLEYVSLYVNYRCRRGIESQFEALQRGFYELISPSLVENFDERELELLIGGLSKIDLEDWRLYTKLKNCTVESPLVMWFWDIVESYGEDRRARLLQFVTGSPRVPIQGFKALQGVNSELRLFTIHVIRNACTDNLPKSHTCFNRIDLPPYESYEKLRDKLTQAIEETMGFAMQ